MTNAITVFCNAENAHIPTYATDSSAGADLFADIKEPIALKPLERRLIPTGVKLHLPHGVEAQIRPRSGLALKYGITVLNAPGTIDSDYRGEIGVVLVNYGEISYTVRPGDRIAQMVFAAFIQPRFSQTEELSTSRRGDGGFGSTGL